MYGEESTPEETVRMLLFLWIAAIVEIASSAIFDLLAILPETIVSGIGEDRSIERFFGDGYHRSMIEGSTLVYIT